MIRRICILDTETTGLDPKIERVIEVACILFDVEHLAPVESYASLIKSEGNAAEKINRIPPTILTDAADPEIVWKRVRILAKKADVYCAHRADFDKGFCPPDVATLRPWLCSKFDMEWPGTDKIGDDLTHLALAHGLGVVHAHRALSDVDTLSRLFARVGEMRGVEGLQKLIARALRPKKRYIAIVHFLEKDKAKERGFAWGWGSQGVVAEHLRGRPARVGLPVQDQASGQAGIMKYWFDTEFYEDGKTIDLISIGVVGEDGCAFYACNQEAELHRVNPWVREHVLPQLPNYADPAWMTRKQIAERLEAFCSQRPEFWAYYADYDWVVLCQLYGTMMQLPAGWPKFCRDLKQLSVDVGSPQHPPDPEDEHNALADARWNRDLYVFLMAHKVVSSPTLP